MPSHATAPPTGVLDTIDRYFLENRHRLLDIDAFLDRVDRADGNGTGMAGIPGFLERPGVLGIGEPVEADDIDPAGMIRAIRRHAA
jgi:hypothetical protein